MKVHERQELAELYTRRFEEFGTDVRTLGWNGGADQELRFRVLADAAPLQGASICDVGCGFGDLIPYLERRVGKGEFTYTGVDITEALVVEARRLHPEHRFFCTDLLDGTFDEPHDWFFLSGALNYKVEDNWGLTTAMMTRMFELSRKGIAVNFLSSYVNFQRPHNYHHEPERVFAFAKSLTRWVTLRHDYPLWEFTIFCAKEPLA